MRNIHLVTSVIAATACLVHGAPASKPWCEPAYTGIEAADKSTPMMPPSKPDASVKLDLTDDASSSSLTAPGSPSVDRELVSEHMKKGAGHDVSVVDGKNETSHNSLSIGKVQKGDTHDSSTDSRPDYATQTESSLTTKIKPDLTLGKDLTAHSYLSSHDEETAASGVKVDSSSDENSDTLLAVKPVSKDHASKKPGLEKPGSGGPTSVKLGSSLDSESSIFDKNKGDATIAEYVTKKPDSSINSDNEYHNLKHPGKMESALQDDHNSIPGPISESKTATEYGSNTREAVVGAETDKKGADETTASISKEEKSSSEEESVTRGGDQSAVFDTPSSVHVSGSKEKNISNLTSGSDTNTIQDDDGSSEINLHLESKKPSSHKATVDAVEESSDSYESTSKSSSSSNQNFESSSDIAPSSDGVSKSGPSSSIEDHTNIHSGLYNSDNGKDKEQDQKSTPQKGRLPGGTRTPLVEYSELDLHGTTAEEVFTGSRGHVAAEESDVNSKETSKGPVLEGKKQQGSSKPAVNSQLEISNKQGGTKPAQGSKTEGFSTLSHVSDESEDVKPGSGGVEDLSRPVIKVDTHQKEDLHKQVSDSHHADSRKPVVPNQSSSTRPSSALNNAENSDGPGAGTGAHTGQNPRPVTNNVHPPKINSQITRPQMGSISEYTGTGTRPSTDESTLVPRPVAFEKDASSNGLYHTNQNSESGHVDTHLSVPSKMTPDADVDEEKNKGSVHGLGFTKPGSGSIPSKVTSNRTNSKIKDTDGPGSQHDHFSSSGTREDDKDKGPGHVYGQGRPSSIHESSSNLEDSDGLDDMIGGVSDSDVKPVVEMKNKKPGMIQKETEKKDDKVQELDNQSENLKEAEKKPSKFKKPLGTAEDSSELGNKMGEPDNVEETGNAQGLETETKESNQSEKAEGSEELENKMGEPEDVEKTGDAPELETKIKEPDQSEKVENSQGLDTKTKKTKHPEKTGNSKDVDNKATTPSEPSKKGDTPQELNDKTSNPKPKNSTKPAKPAKNTSSKPTTPTATATTTTTTTTTKNSTNTHPSSTKTGPAKPGDTFTSELINDPSLFGHISKKKNEKVEFLAKPIMHVVRPFFG